MTHVQRAKSDAPKLQAAIAEHIRWVTGEIESGICEEIRRFAPSFDPTPDPNRIDPWVANEQAMKQDITELKAKVASARQELNDVRKAIAARASIGISSRAKVIRTYQAQMSHILDAVAELAFCDRAKDEVSREISAKKAQHSAALHQLKGAV